MRNTFFCRAAFAASTLQFAIAQGTVPSDLGSDFSLELQVSYTGDASNGFKAGTTFSKDQVSEEPTFALGDSDGIAPSILYTMILVDTTDDNARTLHYARSNFKHSEGVKLETESQPLFEYKAPGTLGETGGDRSLTFLMYINPQRKEIQSLNMPGDGEAFDVKKFQDDNGLRDPSGALAMVVSLDGAGSPAESFSSSPAQSTTAAAPSSTTASGAPTSANAPSSAASSIASSTRAPASTTAAQESDAAPVPSTSNSAEESQAQTSATGPTASLAPATNTTLVPTSPTPSTVVPSTIVPGPSGTTTNVPAEQTESGAMMLSLPWAGCAVLAPVVAFVGLLM